MAENSPEQPLGTFTYTVDNQPLVSYTGVHISILFDLHRVGSEESSSPYVVANLSTLSISSHREKLPVRALGHTNARGYTYGPRTVAGTMVFVNLDKGILQALQEGLSDTNIYKDGITKLDQLPPFDVLGEIASENGLLFNFKLSGVTFVDNGVTLGVDEGFTETVVQYMAIDNNDIQQIANVRNVFK